MIKKINKYINFSIIISILLMILGIVIFIYPAVTLKVFSYIISIVLIIFGIYLIIEDYRFEKLWILFDFSLLGITLLLLGVILLMYPNTLTILIPIFLGMWFIMSGLMKFKLTSLITYTNSSIWILSLLMAILSMICGVLFIISPLSSALALVSFFGILMFVYSLSDIIDMIIFKKNISTIKDNLKDKIIITVE